MVGGAKGYATGARAFGMDDGDRCENQPLSGLIDETGDIPALREQIKSMARVARDDATGLLAKAERFGLIEL